MSARNTTASTRQTTASTRRTKASTRRTTATPRAPARPAPRPPVDEAAEQQVELTVLARQAGVRLSLVRRYLAFGLLEPCSESTHAPLFEQASAAWVARAERLRRDLRLNYAGVVPVSELLDRIEELEDSLRRGGPE